MEENYDEIDKADNGMDDNSLFMKYVIGDDRDLMAIDNLIGSAFAAVSNE